MRTSIETLIEIRSGRLKERRRVICIIGLHRKVFLTEYTDANRNVFVRSWRCASCNELFIKTIH